MSYLLSQNDKEHSSNLELSAATTLDGPKDLFFVSTEGLRVDSRQAPIVLRSKLFRHLITSGDCWRENCRGISVAASASTIQRFLDFLTLGFAWSCSIGELKRALELAKDLGVDARDFSIESSTDVNENFLKNEDSSQISLNTDGESLPQTPLDLKNNVANVKISPDIKFILENDSTERNVYSKEFCTKKANGKEVDNKLATKYKRTVHRDKLLIDDYLNSKKYLEPKCDKKEFDVPGFIRRRVSENNNFIAFVEDVAISSSSYEDSPFSKTMSKKNHECVKCGKTFSSKMTLTRHYVIHSDQRPFKCDDCGKEFNYKGNYFLHRKKWHNNGSD